MFSMRVSFTVKVSVRVIQVAILFCNCEATQPRRIITINFGVSDAAVKTLLSPKLRVKLGFLPDSSWTPDPFYCSPSFHSANNLLE